MSVLIKGFKMPEDCRDCPLEMYYMNSGETRCRARNKILAENFTTIPFDGRPDFCPLVEVLVPHGRLIEVTDELLTALSNFIAETGIDEGPYMSASDWIEMNAPTVIEAEVTE